MHLSLNSSQERAVRCPLKPTIVIAGPGSGKTHVIISRIHYMIDYLKCAPQHILVVTFSKLAALEMQDRFAKIYETPGVVFGTLHSIFYKILKKADPYKYRLENLLNDNEKKQIIQSLLMKLDVSEEQDFIDEFLRHLSLVKNELISPQYYHPDGISQDVFLKLYFAYESYKERAEKFDFDDMLVDCYHLLSLNDHILKAVRHQYRYVLIDEFQDINRVQFEIIKMLVDKCQNIFAVGDDDQSIYKFRGAKPEFLLDFKNYFKETQIFFLEVNYRSTKSILNCSSALIKYNQNRYTKNLTTPNSSGPFPKLVSCKDGKEQASLVLQQVIDLKGKGEKLSEIAIIYRTNLEARAVIEMLLTAHIPFYIRDGMITLYDQWITKDILAYLTLSKDLNNVPMALQIINKPKRYISKIVLDSANRLDGNLFSNLLSSDALSEWQKNYIQKLLFDLQTLGEKNLKDAIQYIRKTIGYENYLVDYCEYRKIPSTTLFEVLDEIEDSAQDFTEVTQWEDFLKEVSQNIKKQSENKTLVKDAVILTTIHGAKGLEFNNVFIINLIEGNLPHHKSHQNAEIEEERRLFYVAMTRAKTNLYLYTPQERYGKTSSTSSFIDELISSYLKDYAKQNQLVTHQKFGKGKIVKIMDNGVLAIQFNSHMIRKIDGQYCLCNGIITLEE